MGIVKDTDRGRLLTRRAFILAGLQAGLFMALFARLYGLQVKQGERFQTLADENRVSMRLIVPPRGIISDRNGIVLAQSRKSFRADLIPEQSQDIQKTLRRLYELMPFADWEKKRIAHDIKKSRSFMPLPLRDNIDWEQMALLELNTPDLPGVVIEAGETRFYPLAEATSHILGYVGIPNEEEAKTDPVMTQPGFRIGKNGLERFYDKQLRGDAGTVQLEVNAYGRPVRELNRLEGVPGHEVRLSIDSELQRFTQTRLANVESAAAVIMDAVDGQVYALVSHPSFDANAFTPGITKDLWAKLTSDPKVPLLNKAVLGLYAPGSTFKVVTALAALQAGVSPKTAIFCPGHLDFGTHRFHCWKKGGHGTVDMKRGIVQSCDVFFYHMAQRIGIDAIHATALKLGLSAKSGIDLPHEKTGVVPSTEWKKKNFKEAWQGGETLVAAIGQGYMLVSPLQLAVMAARIANDGKAVTPRLMSSIKGENLPPRSFGDIGIPHEHLAFIRDAMLGVCQKGGTASAAQIPVEGFEMAGKTGTSQVRRISKAERATGVVANEDRPWEERDHALFIAFVPADAPRYVAAVIVEHGGGGSKVAAPIARDILMQTLKQDPAKVLPTPFIPPIIKPPEEKAKPAAEPDDEDDIEEIQEMLKETPAP